MNYDTPPPKKALGQHWLHDQTVLHDIVASADISADDTVLEIGPGLGTLTAVLCRTAKQVVAVEFDTKLADGLLSRVPADNLQVVKADILHFDLSALPAGYKVVANIPYYLTSNLIRILSESTNPPHTAVLLVQKEVAQRVAAEPGDTSLLSVTAQFYWRVSLGREVKAELFSPPPKVDSQVLVLHYRSKPLFKDVDTKVFFRVTKAGFAQRRKTLQNSLGGGLRLNRMQTLALCQAAGIDPGHRAQTLSLDDWHALYSAYLTVC